MRHDVMIKTALALLAACACDPVTPPGGPPGECLDNPGELCEGVSVAEGRPVLADPWEPGRRYCEGDRVHGFLPGQETGCKVHVFECQDEAACSKAGPSSPENLAAEGELPGWESGFWRQVPDARLGAVQCAMQGIGSCLPCPATGCTP